MLPLTLLAVAAGVVFAELFGYWLHRLLHSEKLPWLSRSHMEHHLREYHPSKPIRLKGIYLSSGASRANVAGIGLEWLAPIAGMAVAVEGVFYAAGAPPLIAAAFTAAASVWSWLLFNTMHDAMHLQGFWMETSPWLKGWFAKVRRRHDIHHYTFSDAGAMTANFGICFFFWDRVFGTLATRQERLNRNGLAAAELLHGLR